MPAAAAALPPHDETRPNVMREAAVQVAQAQPGPTPVKRAGAAAQLGTATRRPGREVFGFADAGSLGDTTVGYPSWDFSQLSTVAYFGLSVGPSGALNQDGGWNVMNSPTFAGFRDTAHAAGARVVLTLVLQDLGANMCSGLANRQATVNQAVPLVTSMNVDGVNLDYEGTYQQCADGQTNQAMLVDLAARLRAALPAGRSYLTIDTYASSAADTTACNCGFFDVRSLNAYVDAFFVMEYALESSNSSRPPLSCASGTLCLSPTSPLGGYYWNDTTTNQQYAGLVGAAKVIMGVPYYGDKACVASTAPNGASAGNYATSGYYYNKSIAGQSTVNSFSAHRDANDPAGNERWDSYYFNDTSPGGFTCWRELYWDDASSLATKYQLVLAQGLRGVGLWNLNLGGGTAASPELWSTLAQYFNCPASVSVSPAQAFTTFQVSLAAPCAAASFDVQAADLTLGQGFQIIGSTAGTQLTVSGQPSHSYAYQARSHSAGGVSAWSALATTTVSATAGSPRPFGVLYTLDGWGGVHGDDSPPLATSAYWPGWSIARALKALPGGQSGVVLDGWGGLHGSGGPLTVTPTAYWPGWDIARDLALLPDGSGGYVLDGWGGLHPFGLNGHPAPPAARVSAYWPGWDIARKLVVFGDGSGGYVLDGWGGLHAFAVGAAPLPTDPAVSAYWPGWDIARDLALVPGGRSGYVLDGWGGLHQFGGATPLAAPAYWPGWDIARSIVIYAPTAGYVLDGWGGIHEFGGAPAIASYAYWPGWDIARGLSSG
ncbi:MAG TPA: glycosyl hydrolase family 18 protein [Candidatus Dormibacteraeota bacterium]